MRRIWLVQTGLVGRSTLCCSVALDSFPVLLVIAKIRIKARYIYALIYICVYCINSVYVYIVMYVYILVCFMIIYVRMLYMRSGYIL